MQTISERSERILIFLGVIFYIFVFPHGIHGDGYARYSVLETLINTRVWTEVKYPMIGTLFSAPLYFIGYLVKTHNWWMSRYNTFIFLFFLFAVFSALKPYLSRPTLRRFLLFLMAGSMFSKHVTDFYGEVFTATCIAIGIIFLLQKKYSWSVFLLSVGIANTPTMIVPLACTLTIYAIWKKQFRYFLIIFAPAITIFIENYLRRGEFLNFGYQMSEAIAPQSIQPYSGLPGFSYPIFFGIISVLFSYGKGLVFYLPGVFSFSPQSNSSLKKIIKDLLNLWLIFLLALILTYAKWYSWFGGWYWGPRFFLFGSIPASLCLALIWDRSSLSVWNIFLVFLVTTMAIWVSASGVSFGQNNMEVCAGTMEYLCIYVPEFSALWRPFIAEKGLHGKQIAFLAYHGLVWLYFMYLLTSTFILQYKEAIFSFYQTSLRLKDWRF